MNGDEWRLSVFDALKKVTGVIKKIKKGETMAILFDKIKKDVKKGTEEGIAAVKERASVVSGE